MRVHRLRINAGGPSKFRKGRFQFSWFLIVPQAFRCWEFERTRQKNDPHAAPHCVRCSATRTVLVAFTRNLTQINAILPGEQCIHILRIIALGLKSPSGFARKAAIVARRERSIQRRIDRKRKRKPKSKRKSAIQAGARTIPKSGNRFSERSCAMNDTNETRGKMVALARSSRPQPQITEASAFGTDVLEGLSTTPKRVPAKYFYDDAGSQLFERITEMPEYYPTRCEMRILRDHAADIAKLIPEGAALVEFGSGSNKKARILLHEAPKLAAYVPVDICGEMLEREVAELRPDFSQLKILPVTADFCFPFELPAEAKAAPVRVGFFPGSTIGNFEPHE